MKIFRQKYVVETFSLFTLIIFLNMSFVLAEVSALKMDQDNAIIKNIAALIAGCTSEEEPGGTSDEDNTVNEIQLMLDHHTHTPYFIDILSKNKARTTTLGVPRLGNYEIFSPPPEA
jgi:hypothetical protein